MLFLFISVWLKTNVLFPKLEQKVDAYSYDQNRYFTGNLSATDLSTPKTRDFPGGPVVENLPSNVGDMGSTPGQGTRIPHASQGNNNKRIKRTNISNQSSRRKEKTRCRNCLRDIGP